MARCAAPWRTTALATVLTLLAPTGARAENWPQWRGPTFTGASGETAAPASWDVAWAVDMPGASASTPAIWGDRLFASSVDDATKQLLAMCLDARTGRVLWSHPVGPDRKTLGEKQNGSSPSPATDGKTVYFFYGTGILAAFDFAGRQLWSRDLERDYGEFVIKWGAAGSALLYRGMLYVMVLQNTKPDRYHASTRAGPLESFLLGIDAKTGRTVFRHVRPTDATDESTESYTTPVPFEGNGRAEVIVHGGEFVTGHDPATGAEFWRWEFAPHDRKVWQRTVAPVTVAGDTLYVPRPKYRPLFALRPRGDGRLGDDIVRWQLDDKTPDVTAALLHRGRIYALNCEPRYLTCLDAGTGRVVWQQKLATKGQFRSSPTGVGDRVYCVSMEGEVLELAAGDEYKVLATHQVEGTPVQSTIAVSNGRLYLRTATKLYCIGKAR